jgi:hypothetical protein
VKAKNKKSKLYTVALSTTCKKGHEEHVCLKRSTKRDDAMRILIQVGSNSKRLVTMSMSEELGSKQGSVACAVFSADESRAKKGMKVRFLVETESNKAK